MENSQRPPAFLAPHASPSPSVYAPPDAARTTGRPDRLPGALPGARLAPRLLGVALAVATLGGCAEREGGGSGDAGGSADGARDADDCSIEGRRAWVEAGMRDYYLFADAVPSVRLEAHDSDESLLEAMRVEPPDRYSYLTDEARYDALFDEGMTFGFGWDFTRVDDETLLFSRVLPGSPAERAGIVRGERLVAIDGEALAAFLERPLEERDRTLGLPDTPTTIALGVESPDGTRREVSVGSESFPLVTVEALDVVEHAGTRVGYLRFASFLETSRAELDDAFDTLAAKDVGELVLDLRYNGGGRVDVAADLAGGIGGTVLAGKTFASFRRNERYAEFDVDIDFGQRFAALDLARVFVLTTAGTCSASELVINSLEPFINVVTIGEATCGKPFGTSPDRHCGRVLNALSVSFENAADVGGYVDGLAPDCRVDEDPRTPMGSAGDPLYDTALGFVTNERCGALAARTAARAALHDGPGTFAGATLGGSDPLFENAVVP